MCHPEPVHKAERIKTNWVEQINGHKQLTVRSTINADSSADVSMTLVVNSHGSGWSTGQTGWILIGPGGRPGRARLVRVQTGQTGLARTGRGSTDWAWVSMVG
ncbi:hypothetical protein V6N11_047761 [Hibiscus sabdariffa]|uniref:Uncharacterized protein n=1 Tax=Hibiscus sabdariffa TaxID=183260 RepID=A0ABR2P8Q3_9ROSI